MTTQSRDGGGDGTYFRERYPQVRFPIARPGQPGLRRGQIGALHSIAAHFALKSDPAVVTMPTGSGKTVVIGLAAFLLGARRVLAITPSRLVRNQIAEEFATLGRARETGSLPEAVGRPAVIEVEHRLNTPESWLSLAAFDVVVGTPNCVSPALKTVAEPPADCFDLILVDEAHHSPARTWREVLAAFPAARKLLVTATPFRRDRQEIEGKFIFEYPVRQAFEDGVFGRIEFHPVEDRGPSQNDVAIPTAAEALLRSDRDSGLNHFLMVRTDLKSRAEELERIYKTATKLNLRRIDSSYSLRYVKATVEALKRMELDGIIAVDMLGEGFDFANLKIAAVHSPHRSLAATLQFIGRFARTGGAELGQAKFVAVAQEIRGSIAELYAEGAEWQDIVPMLTDRRIQDEIGTRSVLADFRVDERYPVDEDTKDLSLYGMRPYVHVKIYRVSPDLDITGDVEMSGHLEVTHREMSGDGTTVVFITREEGQPKWAPPGRFRKVEYDLFIVYVDRESGLAFICSSRRTESVYRHLIAQFAGDQQEILSVEVVNRVVRGIDHPEAFSVGMRNRMQSSSESYRIMAGPNPAKTIRRSDGRMYHRGHAMFRGLEAGVAVTIGFSSSSRVWSNAYVQIPELLAWCRHIAAKIRKTGVPSTDSNWDLLPAAELIDTLPDRPAIAVNWDKDVFLEQPFAQVGLGSAAREIPLLDYDISLDETQAAGSITFTVEHDGERWPLRFTADGGTAIVPVGWSAEDGPRVEWEGEVMTLPDFFLNSPPTFFFSDFSTLTGKEFVPAVTEGLAFDPGRIEVVGWNAENVDIRKERRDPAPGLISIHTYLRARLSREKHAVVVYDDGSGEVADFVAIDDDPKAIRITLYHAKGSRTSVPGERVDDVYEVCGQAVKSLHWTASPSKLLERLMTRVAAQPGARLVAGTQATLKRLRDAASGRRVLYHMVVVQPGISRAALTSNTAALPLASAEEFVIAGGFEDLGVLGSA